MVWKARVGNDPLQLDSIAAGVSLQLLHDDPPGLPNLPLPNQHRHPRDDGAKDIIIFKGQEPSQGDFNICNWLLVVLSGTLALQSSTEALLISFWKFFLHPTPA